MVKQQCLFGTFLTKKVPGRHFLVPESWRKGVKMTEPNRQSGETEERIIEIEIERLRPFKEHPFQVKDDQVTKIIDTILESHSGDVNILFTSKDVLLQFGWDCLNINIYNPDEEMCMLFEKIAASEGLFWRKSE